MARMVQCIKLGREAEGLDFPPYPGELGKRIYENVSKEAWAQWLKQQTMLVNENRLSLADPRARKYLAEQMERHFFGARRRRLRLRSAKGMNQALEQRAASLSGTLGLSAADARPVEVLDPRAIALASEFAEMNVR